METTFFKQMNPDAPESGCVDIKYKGGGDVSKRIHRNNFSKILVKYVGSFGKKKTI